MAMNHPIEVGKKYAKVGDTYPERVVKRGPHEISLLVVPWQILAF